VYCVSSGTCGLGQHLRQEVAVRMIPARALFALAAVVGFSALCTAELSAAPAAATTDASTAQPLEWLKSGNYSALEQYYSQRQSDYEAGKASDEQLYASFRKLYENNWDNEGNFDRWLQAYPASYSATLARGAYLYRMAWSVRGDRYFPETSNEQVAAMRNYLARARPALLASLKMTRKPYLSTLYLLNAALLDSRKDERSHWFELGTALDPQNTLLRIRYMWGLRPRWGGSYDEMQNFLHQCEDQKLQPALLARLGMLIHADMAEDAMRAADLSKSFDEWGQVLKLAGTANQLPGTEALIGYARAAWELNRRADAERALAQLSDRNLDDAWSLAQVGWMYAKEHRDAEAWPLLLKAAKLNDPWAQFTVGNTTYRGSADIHLNVDQAGGLEWIRRSADQCFAEAKNFLAAHGYPQSPGCDSKVGAPIRPERSWLAPAIQWALYGVLMSLVVGWIASSRTRARPAGEARRLQHPPSTLILGMLGLTFFLALAILSKVYDNGTGGPVVTGVFLGFAALSLLVIAEYCVARHELTSDGMHYGKLTGARGSLKWSEVTHVTYSPSMKWYRLQASNGAVVRISAMLMGLPEFAREMLAHVARPAIDDKSWSMLQATARGDLPKIWA
jgi:hypothetical protein